MMSRGGGNSVGQTWKNVELTFVQSLKFTEEVGFVAVCSLTGLERHWTALQHQGKAHSNGDPARVLLLSPGLLYFTLHENKYDISKLQMSPVWTWASN